MEKPLTADELRFSIQLGDLGTLDADPTSRLVLDLCGYDELCKRLARAPNHVFHTDQKEPQSMMTPDERTKAVLMERGAAFKDVSEDELQRASADGGWIILKSYERPYARADNGMILSVSRYVLAQVDALPAILKARASEMEAERRANKAQSDAYGDRRKMRVAEEDAARHLSEKEEHAKDLEALRTERDGLLQTVSSQRQTIKLQDEAVAAREKDHTAAMAAALAKALASRKSAPRRRKRKVLKPVTLADLAPAKRTRKGKA